MAGKLPGVMISDASVGATQLAADSVAASEIAADAVGAAEIAAGAVGTSEIADGAVATADLQDGAVTGAKIADGTIQSADIDPAARSVFTKSYTSTNQTISSGGLLTLAHGLGAVPKLVTAELVCQTAELGYSIGDIVEIVTTSGIDTNGSTRGIGIRKDATNLLVRYGTNAAPITILPAAGTAMSAITAANWRLVMRAYA